MIICISSYAFAQQSSKAELIDEFENFNCEEFKARMDNFYIHLNDNSSAKGYLVISGNKTQTTRKLAAELLLESAVVARAYDRSRIQVIKGPESGPVNIKLWSVPAGGRETRLSRKQVGANVPKGRKTIPVGNRYGGHLPSSSV